MKMRRRLSEARAARARVALANARLGASMKALTSWPQQRPLTCVGGAAGVGWVLGQQRLHPWLASGTIRLLSRQVLPWAARLAGMARGDPA